MYTINKALVLGKVIRERINDLKGLRQSASTRRSILGDVRETTEPTYDIKELDKRILKLQNFAYQVEAAIKETNNITYVTIPLGLEEELFKSIE